LILAQENDFKIAETLLRDATPLKMESFSNSSDTIVSSMKQKTDTEMETISKPNFWICNLCTFHNYLRKEMCEVCFSIPDSMHHNISLRRIAQNAKPTVAEPEIPLTTESIRKKDESTSDLANTTQTTRDVPYDVVQQREMVHYIVAQVNNLSDAVRAHDQVLDVLVNKTKECPSLVMLIPCKKKAWKDWLSPTTFTQDKFMLTFICPVSLCVVECGPDGLGWEVAEPKKWVKKWGPALLVTLKVLQVAAMAGRLLGLPIPCLPTFDSLGLGLNSDSNFLNDFMSSSWDQIACCTVETGLNSASSELSKSSASSIPSLNAATTDHTLLKFSDEAYKAVHSFVTQFGIIEDLLRGKMSRVKHGPYVEWVSDGMIEVWKNGLKYREREALPAPPIAATSSKSPKELLQPLPPPPPPPYLQSASPSSVFPWLADQLTKSTKLSLSNISYIIQILVSVGIDSEDILVNINEERFTDDYLDSIGIKDPGVQQKLLRIHKELRVDSKVAPAQHAPVEELASAKRLRELELKVDAMRGSVASEIDSDIAVGGGNQKMMVKSKQAMERQSGNQSSLFELNMEIRVAHLESAMQELSKHGSLTEQNIEINPNLVKAHENAKKALFKKKS